MFISVILVMHFSNFEQWLASLEYINFEDTEMILNIVEEAQEGFFRGNKQSKGE